MEWKIGEIKQIKGEWYQCIPDAIDDNCNNCFFQKSCSNITGDCSSTLRSDGKSVVFKKLEKVGEPYRYQGIGIIMVQEYILANTNYIWEYSQDVVVMDCQNGKVAIEIKQNKEDMEEKKQKLDKLVDDYMACRIQYAEFDKEIKALYDKEKSEPTLKPFDLETAKGGKPVCTRDGRKARIICFDVKHKRPIAALITNDDTEEVHFYYDNGRSNEFQQYCYDLMMLPEKKEGWVNIDKGGSGKITISSPYSTKEEAIHNDNECTIDTVKINWEE